MAQQGIKYTFETSNGTQIGDVFPMESNGESNLSQPRQIQNVLIINNRPVFIINGDLAQRFVAGFNFDIEITDAAPVDTQFAGSYVVGSFEYEPGNIINGALYDPIKDITYIPANSTVPREAASVLRIDTDTNAIYVAAQSACLYIPTTQIELTSTLNSNDGTYTINQVEEAGTYQVQNILNSQTFTIFGEYAHIFREDFVFTLVGDSSNPAFGVDYTVDSADNVSGTTTIRLKVGAGYNEIPNGSTVTGSLTLRTPTTYIEVVESLQATEVNEGIVTVSETGVFDIVVMNVLNISTTPQTQVLIEIDGDRSAYFDHFVNSSCQIQVKDNAFLQNNRLQVNTVTFSNATNRTSITATVYKSVSAEDQFPNIGGTIITPPLSTEYGYIRYSVPNVLTSLRLIGHGTSFFNAETSWGYAIQQNLINLLDNFASTISPGNPLTGQIWYDLNDEVMRVMSPTGWRNIVTTSGVGDQDLDMNGYRIINLGDPIDPTDALNLQTADNLYVHAGGDTLTGDYEFDGEARLVLSEPTQSIDLSGGSTINVDDSSVTLSSDSSIHLTDASLISFEGSGTLSMGGNAIINVGSPVNGTDAVNKTYVDSLSSGIVWISPVIDPNVFDDTLLGPPDPDVDPLVKFDKTYYVTQAGATGDWAPFAGHLVNYTSINPEDPGVPYTWGSVLGQPIEVGARVGVFFDPKNNAPGVIEAAGNFVGQTGKVAIASAIDPITKEVTWDFVTPSEPDAVSVNGPRSARFRMSYTFRGTWGVGQFGVDYDWIEFAGPTAVIPGNGLKYTDNVLSIVTGPSMTTENGQLDVVPDSPGLNNRFVKRSGDTMIGPLTLQSDPAGALQASTKQYTDARDAATLTSANAYTDGRIATTEAAITAGDNATLTSANTYTNTQINTVLKLSGGTMTGFLTLSGDPTANLHAATKQYVDNAVTGGIGGNFLRLDGTNSPTADISFAGNKLTNLGTPTANADAATKQYVDAAVSGGGAVDVKDVKVTSADTDAGFLADKIIEGTGITITEVDTGGGNLALSISTGSPAQPPRQEKVSLQNGIDFVAGTTTVVTIATNRPTIKNNLDIFMDGVYQHSPTYSYNATTGEITFTSVIPLYVNYIELKWLFIPA